VVFSKADWFDVVKGVVATLLTGLVATAIRWLWSKIPPSYRVPLIAVGVLCVALIWIAFLGFRRIRDSFRFRSKLVIRVKDVTCLLEKTEVRSARGGPTRTEFKWRPEYIIEVENKRRVPVSDLEGDIQLYLLSQESDPLGKRLGAFSLEGNQTLLFWIQFPKIAFSKEHIGMYPNGEYRLEYTYSCTVHSKRLDGETATVRGKLEKADWMAPRGCLVDLLHSIKVFSFPNSVRR
jgi:hypothetical protein